MADLYQIENSYFTAQLTSTGAEIKRLFAKPWHRELMWVPHDEMTRKFWNRTSPILFPIVGKLKDDKYIAGGKTFQMTQHGFARDADFKCTECGSSEITFQLDATQETFKYYPFCFTLLVSYKLVDKFIHFSYSVINTDRQDIYFSIGGHPSFQTPEIGAYEIQFEKKEKGFFQLEKSLVNWKQLTAINTQNIIPDSVLFSKDALIFKDVKSNYIDLINHKKHETIRVHGTNTPYLGIWAKDHVPFICIEPWYGVSDEVGHDQKLETKKGIQTLAAGGTFKFQYSIEIMT
jgi:galactose mutarotase-like enzyme